MPGFKFYSKPEVKQVFCTLKYLKKISKEIEAQIRVRSLNTLLNDVVEKTVKIKRGRQFLYTDKENRMHWGDRGDMFLISELEPILNRAEIAPLKDQIKIVRLKLVEDAGLPYQDWSES